MEVAFQQEVSCNILLTGQHHGVRPASSELAMDFTRIVAKLPAETHLFWAAAIALTLCPPSPHPCKRKSG